MESRTAHPSPPRSAARRTNPWRVALPLLLAATALGPARAAFSEVGFRSPPRTMAHSVSSPDYKRENLPNGQWRPETYALGIGQRIDPTGGDPSLTALSVEQMAAAIAEALYRQSYIPETDPDQTDLMIVVNWGRTVPYSDGFKQTSVDMMTEAMNAMGSLNMAIGMGDAPGSLAGSSAGADTGQQIAQLETLLLVQDMSNRARRQANEFNARLLGFAPDLSDYYITNPLGGPQRLLLDELEDEVEAERYFVILQAFDFQKLTQAKTKDLLWIARFSIRAKGRQFDQELANMAKAAASLFGTDSRKLKRNLLPGTAAPGELQVIDVLEEEEEEISSQ